MLKIGEFSKLSHITIKALRYYEKENLLVPASIDEWTGYRLYDTSQLERAVAIKAYRQLDLTINEIKAILSGEDVEEILVKKAKTLSAQRDEINIRLSIINHILEEKQMKYQVIKKSVGAVTVYYSETVLDRYQDIMSWIPSLGEECRRLNPELKCAEPAYEFCEWLDLEHKETNVRVRHNEAVVCKGNENEIIKFREIPEVNVLSVFHKGSYESIGDAYAYLIKYAEENGYKISDVPRECYIDGIWNKESEADWLTEIQLPIK